MLLTFIASMNSAASPSATNTPTAISTLVVCLMCSSKHLRRQYEIEPQHGERGMHHGAGGGAAHAYGGRHGIVAFEYRAPGCDETERHTLYYAVQHVLEHIHSGLHLRPECTLIDAKQTATDQMAAQDTDRAEARRQQR